jgi:hypothetical protein
MSDDRSLQLKRQLFDEIWEEISSLKGKELDDYLASIGLNPEDLLGDYSKAMAAAIAAPMRARFEEARHVVRQRHAGGGSAKILAFDLTRKKQIMDALKDHPEMTRAARNGRIEDENDIDVFLEACLRLGVIDSDGNLKG